MSLLNRAFNATANFYRIVWATRLEQSHAITGAQRLAYQDLQEVEAERKQRFQYEVKEMQASDVLEKALIRAEANKRFGVISAARYHEIVERVDALKKLRVVEDWEQWQDPVTYEYMKFKVAAEIGGEEEQEAFQLFEKMQIDEKGENQFKLWRQRVDTDPRAANVLGFF